ncbi:MAG: IS110 family transposase [Gammaproteobacteria bacterium]
MALYCGIDLHSNNHVIVVIDEHDQRIEERRIDNDLMHTLSVLNPYQDQLAGIAVESTFNWYWLVDGLQDAGFRVDWVNPAGIKQYEGLKYSDDRYDAFWLAHLMRLGLLKTGYIYPREQRAIRDLLRRRMQLVRTGSRQLICAQSQIWRSTGIRISCNQLKKTDVIVTLPDEATQLAVDSHLRVYQAISHEIAQLEQRIMAEIKPRDSYGIITSMTGVGPILGTTIVLETGDIGRFEQVGHYASYCRCVKSEKTSNGKKKGEGNAKSGNKYLSWAFSEAAHFAVRYEPLAKRFYERKRRKNNGIVAIRSVAHKLARAAYYMLRDQTRFDAARLFAS